ncbi:putative monovalent cation/H+ antiporter subunit A [Belliella kenyensis]|uniref:Monovalent cation/H+ antiporter subunit A n=1 Tax=Belliella kenyensis TaxID=1472724 RepID=A0ABV8EJY6_9BACT|nr:putative monovalent cation/H+ antiporter subunit A [Belliella kenyensis]MCH7403517.1 putative monovalent cation/H+ antiporter subunit A [Belliella kenyensis]MDN3604961.1 putative monovalent cation/H+ antiporter subunit A [Belliella kenyensis]
MILAILSGFVLAGCTPFISKFIKGKGSLLLPILPFGLFVYFFSFLKEIGEGQTFRFNYDWVPSYGINFGFHLDGLAILFALLITGVGTLVFTYTTSYLKGHHYLDRFYGYLSMFMASMLGLVLSDNIITLFIFWELTSISSFFLIGFNNDDPKSRKSALLALSITGLGGLFLLAGMVLLGYIGGSYQFQELLSQSTFIKEHTSYGWIVGLIFIGAFTKSAQFPFHFWLPGAMKAPTPVSTYLHSATMVKAGIYLLARFTPLLGGSAEWNTTLILVGSITMVYAAIHSVLRIDMKGILAYSTISALGILVFLIGLGTEASLLAAGVFILVHALYKATLFLITGIVDHETGTRDVTVLSGLSKVLMPVAIAAGLAALSNAGAPPFFGFIGKDLIYEATLAYGDWAMVLTIAAVVTNVCLLFAGLLAGVKPFVGSLPSNFTSLHLPHPTMWIPPLILAGLGLVFGLFPSLVEGLIVQPVFSSMVIDGAPVHIKLWHGFNLVLGLSLLTLTLGVILYMIVKPSSSLFSKTLKFEMIAPQTLFEIFGKFFNAFARFWTGLFQNGYLRNYVITILGFLTILLAYRLYQGVNLYIDTKQLTALTIYEVIVALMMIVAIVFTVFSRSRLVAVASLGVMGYTICLIFLFYSAPDLAMTQFSIDTLTVILFVLVIYNLPKYKNFSSKAVRIRDGILSVFFGSLIAILTLEVLSEPLNRETSIFYAESAYLLAKGKNVVNVILVDFRGFDTMVEITVLVIAAIGVFSLLKLRLKSIEKE